MSKRTQHPPRAWRNKRVFVGIDVHKNRWHVTVRTEDGLVVFRSQINGTWEALRSVLERFSAAKEISAVYEAGYHGFWLYDELLDYGVDACVTPPSHIPRRAGNRVKNDRIDSGKLAEWLQAGILQRCHVPTPEERAHRQVARRRRQLIEDRKRTQQRIKADLRFHGVPLPHDPGRWSAAFVDKLRAIRLPYKHQQHAFDALLQQYDFLTEQIQEQTQVLRGLADSDRYSDRVALLTSAPGIGWLSAIELLLELQDMGRFQRADQLAAFVGLTPAQYSSGDDVHMGHITRQGQPRLRALLTQAAWRSIEVDGAMREKYDRIRARAGGKRAIVAIARTLLLRLRRMVLNDEPYALGLISG